MIDGSLANPDDNLEYSSADAVTELKVTSS